MESAARKRGTGIAKRAPEFIEEKIHTGNAVIALNGDDFAGFSYIGTWEHKEFVANSGLIVHPRYRKTGLARRIKTAIFQLSREKYPEAKIFGITTSLAVMKINSDLGYNPVTFSELPDDDRFWKSCSSCPNYDILNRTNRKHCLCTGMMFDPAAHDEDSDDEFKRYQRWEQFLRAVKYQTIRAKRKLESITLF